MRREEEHGGCHCCLARNQKKQSDYPLCPPSDFRHRYERGDAIDSMAQRSRNLKI